MMIEQLRAAYHNYWWARCGTYASVLVGGALLYWLAGGFPPWAWRFLLHVLPQIPALWAAQGSGVLLPLIGLALLSLSLLILWGILVAIVLRIVQSWWRGFHGRRSFAQDLREAERMAERMAASETARRAGVEEMQRAALAWQPQPIALSAPLPQRQPAYAVARASRVANAPQPSMQVARAPQPASAPLPAPVVERSPAGNYRRPGPAPTGSLRGRLRLVPRVDEEAPRSEFDTQPGMDEAQVIDICRFDTLTDGQSLPQTGPTPAQQNEHKPKPLRLVVGTGLNAGIVRKNAPNEDNLYASQTMRAGQNGPEPVGLFVIADGMGGHANGQMASRLAIQTIADAIMPSLLRDAEEGEALGQLLKEAVHRANLAIYQRNREQEQMMGTTLTAALVVGSTAHIVNVGDSRTYHYRASQGLTQITHDHSTVARLVESGDLAPEDVYTHPHRNQIYRCLGEKPAVEIDTFTKALDPGDILLLCSDGLWEMVRDNNIERIIASSAPHAAQISAMLIQAALIGGGADNVSVVVCALQKEA
jgi:serine/threonine protein phosphatase PrpC